MKTNHEKWYNPTLYYIVIKSLCITGQKNFNVILIIYIGAYTEEACRKINLFLFFILSVYYMDELYILY